MKKTKSTGIALLVVTFMLWVGWTAYANYTFPEQKTVPSSGSAPVLPAVMVDMIKGMTSNWLPNDILYPTVLLDNPQNFQLGELESVRYTVRVLRDKLSRLRTTDKIDLDVEAAFVFLSNDPNKWVLPSAESKFLSGLYALERYDKRLKSGCAHFYPRADNLNELLDQWCSLLGGVNTRLSNAPRNGNRIISEETAGDAYTHGEKRVNTYVPWMQLDDNFYYARGVAYGISQMIKAVKYDFDNIIKVKKTEELVDRIIEVLGHSQLEPLIVMNGGRESILANHSLSLQAVLEDARQKMRSLQDMLKN